MVVTLLQLLVTVAAQNLLRLHAWLLWSLLLADATLQLQLLLVAATLVDAFVVLLVESFSVVSHQLAVAVKSLLQLHHHAVAMQGLHQAVVFHCSIAFVAIVFHVTALDA